MRKSITLTAAALLMASSAALADGVSLKDTPAPAPSPWDVAFGGGIASDYMFRGISQSGHWPSGSAYTELRYNIRPEVQLYGGVSIESIDYPNRAASETDFYFGIRPTFGKLSPRCWRLVLLVSRRPALRRQLGTAIGPNPNCTNGYKIATALAPAGACNVYEADLSFWEIYGKATYAFTDALTLGANVFYDPSWLNEGADGTYASVTVKYVLPATWMPNKDVGAFLSGEFGHYWFGQTNTFYGNIDLPEYSTWNAGISFTYKVFTLDFRYVDTDLSKANCNVLTSDHTATFSPVNETLINPSGLGSNWCGSTFVAKLSFDLTASQNLK